MAAIAYVSDQKMLDFHRVNGNQKIVFWRISTKRFSDFQPGDLLFFLAKGSETRRNSEKGIVGYGCYVGNKQITVDNLWKKYQQMTGYSSKENLITAIQKNTKKENVPEIISCLLLEDVMFFQGPIYLSELGIKLPNNLESFTYLDAHEGHVTLELLQKAKEIGIDHWSAALNNEIIDEKTFDNEVLRYQIASIYESMDLTPMTKSETYKNKCFSLFKDSNPKWVNRDKGSFIILEPRLQLCYLYNSSLKDNKENFIKMLGQLVFIKNNITNTINEEIKINILSNIDFSDTQKETLLDQKFEIIRI